MPIAGHRDAAKERRWRQAIANWQPTGLSIAEFCRQKDLDCRQFYSWIKRLKRRDAALAHDKPYRRNRPEPVVEFAEIHVRGDQRRGHESAPQDVMPTLEVVLADGTKLRISAGCSLDLLASVVNLLEHR